MPMRNNITGPGRGRRRLAAALGALLLAALGALPAAALTNEMPYDSYTYWEDYPGVSKREVYARPMYQPRLSVDALSLGVEAFVDLTDVCTDRDGRTYLLDGGAGTLYVLDADYRLEHIIDGMEAGGERLDFTKARGVYCDTAGALYIADTENARVLKADRTGRLLDTYTLPESNLIPEDFQYRPVKVAVDAKGMLYILSDGSYYGAILYTPKGEFKGFFGSNTVGGGVLDTLTTLYNRLFMNNAKRAASESRLPFQFTDLYVAGDGFVYTSTGRTEKNNLQTGQLRCFSPGGTAADDTASINFADVSIDTIKGANTSPDLLGLALDGEGFIYLVDSAYGRVFVYDKEYRLLSAFGGGLGLGEQLGSFVLPCAVETRGDEVLVCDGGKNSVTVFGLTDYGRLVKTARLLTLDGDYEASRALWEQVLAQDRNSQLAYTGLAKAAYTAGDYAQAMQYAKDGCDRETYAQAYKVVRREAAARWFPLIFLGVLVLVGGVFVLVLCMNRRETALVKNPRVHTMLMAIPHPFDSFAAVREKKYGSLPLSVGLVAAFYILTVLRSVLGGFLYVDYNAAQFNSLFVFLQTVGIVALWSVCNWAVCTLTGGIGKLRDIVTVTAYSLLPVMIGQVLYIALSHVLLPEEAGFLGILTTAATLYTAFMLAVGMMKIHDIGFSKFLGTALLSAACMLVVLFLLFLIVILVQQLGAFLITLGKEILYH